MAVLVGLQEVTAGREGAVEAGGQTCDVSGDVGQDAWRGLVVVGDLKESASHQSQLGLTLAAACASCAVLRSNLGDTTGLFQDGEAGAENLSSGVVLHGGVGGQSDRSESNQIGIPEMDQQTVTILHPEDRKSRILGRVSNHLASHGFLLEANRMKSLPLSPFLIDGVATR